MSKSVVANYCPSGYEHIQELGKRCNLTREQIRRVVKRLPVISVGPYLFVPEGIQIQTEWTGGHSNKYRITIPDS